MLCYGECCLVFDNDSMFSQFNNFMINYVSKSYKSYKKYNIKNIAFEFLDNQRMELPKSNKRWIVETTNSVLVQLNVIIHDLNKKTKLVNAKPIYNEKIGGYCMDIDPNVFTKAYPNVKFATNASNVNFGERDKIKLAICFVNNNKCVFVYDEDIFNKDDIAYIVGNIVKNTYY